MDSENKENVKRRKADRDYRCIWMQDGLIYYKLCSLDFNCENCAMDKVLRGKYPNVLREEPEVLYPEVKTYSFEELIGDQHFSHGYYYALLRILYNYFPVISFSPDVRYFPMHLWIFDVDTNKIRIGLDDLIGKCLDPIKNVVLPLPGDFIQKGSTFGWLFMDDWNVSLCAPVSGQVTAINRITVQNPKFVQLDSHGKGWFLEMTVEKDPSLYRFTVTNQETKQWYRECLLDIFHNVSELINYDMVKTGATAADGGKTVLHLQQVIDKEQYRLLIKELLKYNIDPIAESDKKEKIF